MNKSVLFLAESAYSAAGVRAYFEYNLLQRKIRGVKTSSAPVEEQLLPYEKIKTGGENLTRLVHSLCNAFIPNELVISHFNLTEKVSPDLLKQASVIVLLDERATSFGETLSPEIKQKFYPFDYTEGIETFDYNALIQFVNRPGTGSLLPMVRPSRGVIPFEKTLALAARCFRLHPPGKVIPFPTSNRTRR